MSDKIYKYPQLAFAAKVSERANAAWEDGSFLENVTPTTASLLKYWFDSAFCDVRNINFHDGQRQAILNIIYTHEVLEKHTILDVYEEIAPQLLRDPNNDYEVLGRPTFKNPKYCVKMATGTGKTWVLEALIIWQYLNARHQEEGNYTKNFLIVAPGIIVYERLLDAFLGKTDEIGTRDFYTSDLYKQAELFIPEEYRDEVFGFLQSSVATKHEIGSKVTGDGLIAITNYHLLMGAEKENISNEVNSWSLPVTPGISAGNSLDELDRNLNGKKELEFLAQLPDLMEINDEAHHIHDNIKGGEIHEVEWQRSLNYIAENKGQKFIQLDFSATPYNQKGDKRRYFPHIVVDFELKDAIRKMLVKMLLLDERKELAEEELDYKVIRDENRNPIDLSDGQRVMLRAGLAKLDLLSQEFEEHSGDDKEPKMLVVCEDTNVAPLVVKFLKDEGLGDEEILEIHSNKKGEVGEEEWNNLKGKLFALDRARNPRVVVSVLMLREGFDVNNVCVIVPLRSTTSNILLEQTIGRGLRLMWRGDPIIDEMKAENWKSVLEKKKAAKNYFDVLSIVEHPAFRKFYEELIQEGLVGEEENELDKANVEKVNGDLLTIGLKQNYEEYDFRFPLIISEAEEIMGSPDMDITKLKPYPFSLNSLINLIPQNEQWISTEVTKDVHFGDFEVVNGIFRATSYNDFVARMVKRITEKLNATVDSISSYRQSKNLFPALSISNVEIAEIIDEYIRNRLFGQEIEPNKEEIWKVLRIKQVIDHIVAQISGLIVAVQEQPEVTSESEVKFIPLSSIDRIKVRENFSEELTKSIYERTPFPSNKGGLEHDFMLYADADAGVDAVCKVIENKHTFVRFRYVREDGLPAEYIPDFFVRFGNDVYIVETKAQKDMSVENVLRKKRSARRWIERTNSLPAEKRENLTWHYVLLSDLTFYEWRNKRMELKEILDFAELREDDGNFNGRLF